MGRQELQCAHDHEARIRDSRADVYGFPEKQILDHAVMFQSIPHEDRPRLVSSLEFRAGGRRRDGRGEGRGDADQPRPSTIEQHTTTTHVPFRYLYPPKKTPVHSLSACGD